MGPVEFSPARSVGARPVALRLPQPLIAPFCGRSPLGYANAEPSGIFDPMAP